MNTTNYGDSTAMLDDYSDSRPSQISINRPRKSTKITPNRKSLFKKLNYRFKKNRNEES